MKNLLFLFFLILFPLPLFAAEVTAFDKTLTAFYVLVRTIGALLGGFLAFYSLKKMVDYAKDNRNPKNSPVSILVVMFASSLLLNLNATMSIMINTIQGTGEGYCFYSKAPADNGRVTFDNSNSCFSNAMQVTGDLAEKLKKESGSEETLKKLQDKLRLLFTLFQLVGVIYFIKGIYMLKEASEGTQGVGYGKIIMILIASSLVIDMPHTIDILINTITGWNETV
jgi:hypothetical protein